jgi:lauroyl/myristoyl acyltransferase
VHEVVIPGSLARTPRVRAFSDNDLYEVIAISVLGPASWLVPHRLWDLVSVALSSGIALLRPDITRRRMQRLQRCLAGRPIPDSLFALRVRIMAGYMEERLQILREYRPGGWRGRIELSGREHLDRAIERGRGTVLWVPPFTYGDLIVKTATAREGFPVTHLSACSRGFSPNACHPWEPTRFGMRYLSRLRTAVEDRYLHERMVMPADGSLGYIRRLERLLRSNGILSIRAGRHGHRTMDLPFLEGTVTLATGAPSLALATGAELLPVFVIRRGPGRFEVVFEPPMEPAAGADPHAATTELMDRYARLLQSYVLRFPHMWSGWYSMRFADPER